MEKIIITGSEGLVGTSLKSHLKNKYEILDLDLKNGHNLNDEKFVKEFFNQNKANALINAFAIDDKEDFDNNHTSLNCTIEDFNQYLNTNVTSLFSVCREFIRNNNEGRIINFSSIYGLLSPKNIYGDREKFIGYGVSKAAVNQLTRHLAIHYPNFLINAIAPGGIENNQSKEFKKKYHTHTPLNRMMKVEELNALIDFLLSKNSTYTTGSIIKIDGGWTAW